MRTLFVAIVLSLFSLVASAEWGGRSEPEQGTGFAFELSDEGRMILAYSCKDREFVIELFYIDSDSAPYEFGPTDRGATKVTFQRNRTQAELDNDNFDFVEQYYGISARTPEEKSYGYEILEAANLTEGASVVRLSQHYALLLVPVLINYRYVYVSYRDLLGKDQSHFFSLEGSAKKIRAAIYACYPEEDVE